MHETLTPELKRILAYAETEAKNGGFVYCFRGEVVDKDGNHINDQLVGTWYSEDISTMLHFLKEREQRSQMEGKIFYVVLPRSILNHRDEVDKVRNIINILNPRILGSRVEISKSEALEWKKSQPPKEPLFASKSEYLAQFGL